MTFSEINDLFSVLSNRKGARFFPVEAFLFTVKNETLVINISENFINGDLAEASRLVQRWKKAGLIEKQDHKKPILITPKGRKIARIIEGIRNTI